MQCDTIMEVDFKAIFHLFLVLVIESLVVCMSRFIVYL